MHHFSSPYAIAHCGGAFSDDMRFGMNNKYASICFRIQRKTKSKRRGTPQIICKTFVQAKLQCISSWQQSTHSGENVLTLLFFFLLHPSYSYSHAFPQKIFCTKESEPEYAPALFDLLEFISVEPKSDVYYSFSVPLCKLIRISYFFQHLCKSILINTDSLMLWQLTAKTRNTTCKFFKGQK